MINTFVQCCLSYAMISDTVLKHFISSTNDWQYYYNNYFVILQSPSYDKHICALLLIISCDMLK